MHPMPEQDIREPLPDGLAQAIRATAGDIAGLLRGAADTTVAVPGSEWTLGEAAAHLALANELMADLMLGRERPYGDGTPQSLAAANAQSLDAFPERRAAPLAAMIAEQADVFLDAASRATADRKADGPDIVTPLGPLDRDQFAAYLLTHMLGHGYDLARALGRPHMIDHERAVLCMPFMLRVMPRVTNTVTTTGVTARYTVRLPRGTAFGVALADGELSITPQPLDRPDCTIRINPVTFLLIALGRGNAWQAVARGHITAWGRKPWLAPRFPTLFVAP